VTALPDGGPEKEIFLRALRAYSESCEAPDLTPGCPFAVTTSTGRGCFEECLDILGAHGAPGPVAEVQLGDLTITKSLRPRSRRQSNVPVKPYDARETYLGETSDNVADWKTGSVMSQLLEKVTDPPGASPERNSQVSDAMKELERRGFDVEMLVKEAWRDRLAVSIASSVVVRAEESFGGRYPEAPEGWDQVMALVPELAMAGVASDETTPLASLMRQAGRHVPRIVSWILTTPIEAVVNWIPPNPDEFARLDENLAIEGDGPQKWVSDRFLEAYLSDWQQSSLNLEWRYSHGECVAPCHAKEMRERSIDEVSLAKAIADRAVSDEDRRAAVPLGHQYVRLALDLLREGRREQAAAIFRAVTEVDPRRAEAHNNYGFCILPDDPSRALTAFDAAARLGWEWSPISISNRMVAYVELGKFTTALDLADEVFAKYDDLPATPGWLWSRSAPMSDPKLDDVQDSRAYIVKVAMEAAERSGDDQLIRLWKARMLATGQ
jgi:hypothetical protein